LLLSVFFIFVREGDQCKMVLGELSNRLTSAFRSLGKTEVEDEAVTTCVNAIVRALMEADVPFKTVAGIKSEITTQLALAGEAGNTRRIIEQTVFDSLVKLLSSSKSSFKPKKNRASVVLFLGLQGAGKTTTAAKFTGHFARRGFKSALVCADTFRAGAFDQLRQNAMRVRVPFYGDAAQTDPVVVASEGVRLFRENNYEVIVVDSSGRHKQEAELFQEMRNLISAIQPDACVLVMDSHLGQAASNQAKAFAEIAQVSDIILTKMDGHAKGGGALAAVAATGAPVTFIGTGEGLESLEKFDPKGFVGRLLGRGDLTGLADSLAQAIDVDQQKETVSRIMKGKFSLRDYYGQITTTRKMGPMGKVMSMIPGISGLAGGLPAGVDEMGALKLKRTLVVLDSLTAEELDLGKAVVDESRIRRIARGAGARIEEVLAVMDEFKKIQKVIEKMGKSGLVGKSGNLNDLTRNPKEAMKKLSSVLDPSMMAQLGGPQNLMNMMKDLEANPDMAGLMKQLQQQASGGSRSSSRR
jgi:signal recognition particle subunit SRP54